MKIKPVLGILALIAFAVAAKSQTVETVVTNGLFEPYGVAVDLSTNIYYFTDSVNHRVVKYDPAAVSLTTLITFHW
jgi:membrane-associated PAP2 superfamily phosphatase